VSEAEPPVARRIVQAFEGVNLSLSCRHCEDAPCMDACITGALTKDPHGVVVCDTQRCVGCWMCVMVCRFGLIAPTLIAAKCDMCPAREGLAGKARYACVEACPTDALFAGRYEDFQVQLKQTVEPLLPFERITHERTAP
jgi:carbon-monoxide dehydrogenase iron sulfur subunit